MWKNRKRNLLNDWKEVYNKQHNINRVIIHENEIDWNSEKKRKKIEYYYYYYDDVWKKKRIPRWWWNNGVFECGLRETKGEKWNRGEVGWILNREIFVCVCVCIGSSHCDTVSVVEF